VTLEFPHLLQLVEQNQFDTIYHEHFSYFSLLTTERIFAAHGLVLFDVEELPSHGGSLRVFGRRAGSPSLEPSRAVLELRAREQAAGFGSVGGYAGYTRRVEETKRNLLAFLIEAKRAGKSVVAYGAPGKGNTLLNYCGIRCDFVDFAVDRNPYKHGKFTPGTHIPIRPVEALAEARPDYILILPWNLRREIAAQLEHARDWGARFVVPIPKLEIW
jgi:hypothetical protein